MPPLSCLTVCQIPKVLLITEVPRPTERMAMKTSPLAVESQKNLASSRANTGIPMVLTR